jgi:hypothetical protein
MDLESSLIHYRTCPGLLGVINTVGFHFKAGGLVKKFAIVEVLSFLLPLEFLGLTKKLISLRNIKILV